jgi:transcriptional regulator with PAS, ATPase and Fis domain
MRDKLKILGIAPYTGLKELMQNIAAQRDDIELDAFVGDLSVGVKLVLKHQRCGFSGIVSRGGTAEMIRHVANIPVSEVSLSVYDVLRAIKLAQSYDGRFAIVGFPSITDCAKILCDLLRYEIEIMTVKSQEEIYSCLKMLKKKGCSMVLGDKVTTVNAKFAGFNSILITSGGESVEAAFDHAVEVFEWHRKNLEEIELLNALLLSTKGEVIVFTENKDVKFSTLSSIDEETMIFMKKNVPLTLERGEKKILRQTSTGELLTLLGREFSTATGRYCAFSITRTSKPRIYDGQGVTFQNKIDLVENVSNVLCRNNSSERFTDVIGKYAQSDLPILITGEQGTGKDKMANAIYVHGKLADNPMVSIDCGIVSEKKWIQLIENEFSPFSEEKITIYIKNVDQLSEATGMQLIKYFESTDICQRNRMIFSCTMRHEMDENQFCSGLRNSILCLVLKLHPLRQHPGEIPGLCILYINEINTAMGKEVIGLTPEAMALMQGYSWEFNLHQLRRVLVQLVALSDSPYVSADDVVKVLEAEGRQKSGSVRNNLNLRQPLSEIVRDIAKEVLSEEGMNRSKTACRLQISRSTLWRILKT